MRTTEQKATEPKNAAAKWIVKSAPQCHELLMILCNLNPRRAWVKVRDLILLKANSQSWDLIHNGNSKSGHFDYHCLWQELQIELRVADTPVLSKEALDFLQSLLRIKWRGHRLGFTDRDDIQKKAWKRTCTWIVINTFETIHMNGLKRNILQRYLEIVHKSENGEQYLDELAKTVDLDTAQKILEFLNCCLPEALWTCHDVNKKFARQLAYSMIRNVTGKRGLCLSKLVTYANILHTVATPLRPSVCTEMSRSGLPTEDERLRLCLDTTHSLNSFILALDRLWEQIKGVLVRRENDHTIIRLGPLDFKFFYKDFQDVDVRNETLGSIHLMVCWSHDLDGSPKCPQSIDGQKKAVRAHLVKVSKVVEDWKMDNGVSSPVKIKVEGAYFKHSRPQKRHEAPPPKKVNLDTDIAESIV